MDHVFTTLSARCNNVVANFVDSCSPFVTMFVRTLWHAGNKVDRPHWVALLPCCCSLVTQFVASLGCFVTMLLEPGNTVVASLGCFVTTLWQLRNSSLLPHWVALLSCCGSLVTQFVASLGCFVTMLWQPGNTICCHIGLLCYHVAAAW
jgi:cell shape-determining protein MreD